MKIVTTVDIPADVYLFFLKQAESHPGKTPEDLMAAYLSRYVRQKKYRDERKQKNIEK